MIAIGAQMVAGCGLAYAPGNQAERQPFLRVSRVASGTNFLNDNHQKDLPEKLPTNVQFALYLLPAVTCDVCT